MNFDMSPMQSATSPMGLQVTTPASGPADEFAALLGRSTLVTAHADTKLSTEEPSTDAAAANGQAEGLSAIAKADLLVAALAPAPRVSEAVEPAAEQRPAPVAVAELTRLKLPADIAKGDRKDLRHEYRKSNPEGDAKTSDDNEALVPLATDAAGIAPVAVGALPIPDRAGVAEAQERQDTETVRPLDLLARSVRDVREDAISAPREVAEKSLSLGERPKTDNDLTTLPEVTKTVAETKAQAEGQRPVRPELREILAQLATSKDHETSGTKAAPVRAARIAEIALGLKDAQADGPAVAVQGNAPDNIGASSRSGIETVQAEAPARPTIVERELDLIRNEKWLGELAHDIATSTGESNRLSFRLMPHQLGKLDVDVSRSQNGLSLSIRTESDSAAAILSAAQSRLTDEIRSLGVRLADTQMFSGDSRQSPGQDANARPAQLIETFISPTETVDAPEEERRDGRYA